MLTDPVVFRVWQGLVQASEAGLLRKLEEAERAAAGFPVRAEEGRAALLARLAASEASVGARLERCERDQREAQRRAEGVDQKLAEAAEG
eukprot:722509-Prorocentrum_minimum.AAC.2